MSNKTLHKPGRQTIERWPEKNTGQTIDIFYSLIKQPDRINSKTKRRTRAPARLLQILGSNLLE